jgi:hypothetical protein
MIVTILPEAEMSEPDLYAGKAKKLLERHGLRCIPGSKVAISGKNPDLFCESPSEFWVEVKHIDAPKNFRAQLPRIMESIQKYAETLDVRGRISVYTTLNTDDRDIKMAKRALYYLRGRIDNVCAKDYIIIAV